MTKAVRQIKRIIKKILMLIKPNNKAVYWDDEAEKGFDQAVNSLINEQLKK